MLAVDKVNHVRRLLASGQVSHRNIAALAGVSRATVHAIAHGKRRDYEPQPATDDADSLQPQGPAVRCAGCGGMVYLPCRLCRLRAKQEQHRQVRTQRRVRAREIARRRHLLQIRRLALRQLASGGQPESQGRAV
jgi:hypothetical protein